VERRAFITWLLVTLLMNATFFCQFHSRRTGSIRNLQGQISFTLPYPTSVSQNREIFIVTNIKKTLWLESANELYRPSDRRLSEKILPTFADRGYHVVSVTDPYCSILRFLDRSRYFFFQVAPQLSGPRSRPTTSRRE
jgi:hypothetical protein